MAQRTVLVFCVLLALIFMIAAAPRLQAVVGITVLDRNDAPLSRFTDGDSIKLRLRLAAPAGEPTPISFHLSPDDIAVAECTIAKSSDTCTTAPFPAFGWAWDRQQKRTQVRTLRAVLNAPVPPAPPAPVQVQVATRPVVFAHGFGSSAEAWSTYLGPTGYLASIGVRGFAVGDGQAPGKLALGDLAQPTSPTGTIESNAATLRDYIASVKAATGAQMVDLVAHSMGSLVSRYYVDRVMPGRDVAQVILLGPPNQGTECANLPASLGYYLPAVLQIRPSYVRHIFNSQITHRHGVPFTIVAGTPITEALKSPCTAVPTDLAIAFDSASGIEATVVQVPFWHSDLNVSPAVFQEAVRPLLQKTAGELRDQPDPAAPVPAEDQLQFTRVFTGHVAARGSETQTIHIDSAAVASFALFDPTQSLTVTVRGATGNVIVLDPTRNGLFVVKDPGTLVYLGYGFNNPRPGPWQVTLVATDATPPGGTDYAITAQLQGGAVLKAAANPLLPRVGETVALSAQVQVGGAPVPITQARAQVRSARGDAALVPLAAYGSSISQSAAGSLTWQANWTPGAAGLYSIDVVALATGPDGVPIERTAFLSVEAQPAPEQVQWMRFIVPGVLAAAAVVAVVGAFVARKRQKRDRGANSARI